MIDPNQSALAPAGPQSLEIHRLFDVNLWISCAVWGLVIIALMIAIVRRHRPEDGPPEADPYPPVQRKMTRAVGISVAVTVITLVALLTASVATGRSLAGFTPKDAVTYKVVGHLWWWEFQYDSPEPSEHFVTANEIHVPVGKPLLLELESHDVIHSFWVPSLHGKRDLIPGKHSTLYLRADAPGEYVGQCAEFCGAQHANMRFAIVAESQADFDEWLANQRAPSKSPANAEEKRGLDVFTKSRCINCHAIAGTEAYATAAPDLTHVASRRTIAAGTLFNTPGHLGGWIADPQSAKPGNQMPSNVLSPDDLNALVTYLGSLK